MSQFSGPRGNKDSSELHKTDSLSSMALESLYRADEAKEQCGTIAPSTVFLLLLWVLAVEGKRRGFANSVVGFTVKLYKSLL